MSSTFLWVLLPLAISVALLFYRRSDNWVLFAVLLVSLGLTWTAWQIPVDRVLQLGPLSLEIFPNLQLFGRAFTLGPAEQPLLTMLYLWESLWLVGALLAKPPRLFAPLSMAVVALLVAALAVEPFLYAALMFAAVVLLLIPLLAPAGQAPGHGVQRFLKFQMFAVPCILFTGWLLSGVESSPGNLNLVLRAGVLLALGFSFLLGIFPFHSWIPMLAEESNPYVFGFLIFFLPAVASVFSLGFFDRYVWLRENNFVYQMLLVVGSLSSLLAGLWAIAQRHLGRIFGFAAMLAVGSLLQAIGLRGAMAPETLFAMLLPLVWALWLLALALAVFWREAHTLRLDDLQLSFRAHPLLTISMLAALFAVAGFPFLGAFVAHLGVWVGLALFSPFALAASLLGSLGLLVPIGRVLLAWLGPNQQKAPVNAAKDVLGKPLQPLHDFANPLAWALSLLGLAALLSYGLLPQFFLSSLPALIARFSQLVQ
jgi:NADH:ubiquinone oxidoreductase subunit 4 (subunit M)